MTSIEDLAARWQAEAVSVSGARALAVGLDFLRDPIGAAERCHRRFGPAVALSLSSPWWAATKRTILLGPRYNREILTSTDCLGPAGWWTVPGPPGSVQAEMRFNYRSTTGAEHAGLFKTLVPHLSRERIAGHFEAIRKIVCGGVAGWPTDQQVELCSLVRSLGQATALGLLFGEPDGARAASFGDLVADYHRANWRLGARLLLNLRGLPYADVLAKAERLRDFVRPWVEERQGCPADQDLRAAFAAHRTVAGERLSPERLAAHLNFVGFAAYETVASTLTWTLFLLALHPSVLGDLADELGTAPSAEAIDQADLDALPLLDSVIKEALRLVPPTPLLPWRTITRWETGGVKAKIAVVLNPHLTHRVPEIYAEPFRFRPERWSRIKPTSFEYLPFSAGPRRCPGYGFATAFLKVAVAAFVARWRIDLAPGTRIDYLHRGVTMPRPGIAVRLRPQDRSFRPAQVSGSIHRLVDLDGSGVTRTPTPPRS